MRDKATGELGVAEKAPTKEELLKRVKGDLIDSGFYVANSSYDLRELCLYIHGPVSYIEA